MRCASHIFALVAIVLFTAQPVMACCFLGHAEPAAEMVGGDALQCHDGAVDKSASIGSRADRAPITALSDCPGCDDCDNPIMRAQNSGDSLVMASTVTEIPFVTVAVQFPGFAYPPIILKTGPPGELSLNLPTPITLKQRLLI